HVLENLLGTGRVKENVNLSPYLTLKTKAKARYFFIAESRDDLIHTKRVSIKTGVPLFILGGGSNLVILKKFLDFLVVKNNYIAKKVLEENKKYVVLQVSSGYSVTRLAKETAEAGLGACRAQ
ncbi:FAD-binding protein, partial [Candidatus Roizmanbacteria bacterium]|nr:FAD-binding protein [Candidatus Roizmanbacteria bacterium]